MEHEISDGHRISPHGNTMKGNDLEKDRRVDGETNQTNTAGRHLVVDRARQADVDTAYADT